MNRLVWFRNDLRLLDNEVVSSALADGRGSVSFVYVYDNALEATTAQGFPRASALRKQVLAQSMIDLRNNLRRIGSDLICASGDPVEVVLRLCDQLRIEEVYYARLAPFDEQRQGQELERRLQSAGVRSRSFATHTLLCPDDFAETELNRDMGFSRFRKIAETGWKVRPPLAAPTDISARRASEQPDISRWDLDAVVVERGPERGHGLIGGESAALARVEQYFWTNDRLRIYKQTRNGLLKRDDSSKFSLALALGNVSPRFLYAEVRRYERERTRNASTLWFLYELLWRDYFYFGAHLRGRHLFTDVWTSPAAPATRAEMVERFERWQEGRCGRPFIDAAMNELRLTGWMSNRMRQNAASYLIHDLGVDWRWGASWFESCLVDYDCASNWGNWAYVAGAGPRNRPHVFDIDQQARAYDPDGEYAAYWSS